MALYFKTYASSSTGNCLALWTDRTAVLIDCGLGTMKRTRAVLADMAAIAPPVSAVIISHLHSDHVAYYPLRVLEQAAIPVRVHESDLEPLRRRHFNGYGFPDLPLVPYAGPFDLPGLHIEPFPLSHPPACPTFGFTIRTRIRNRWLKAAIATDFNRPEDVAPHLIDADFIFIESNHDLELLKKYYNPNSRYHMPNPKTAQLLTETRLQSKYPPAAVMLGHLSPQRNRPQLALDTIEAHFRQHLAPKDFPLLTAPQKTPSQTLTIPT
jgi:phosphoribosyl 1,2-cyclic phosphodiesterase